MASVTYCDVANKFTTDELWQSDLFQGLILRLENIESLILHNLIISYSLCQIIKNLNQILFYDEKWMFMLFKLNQCHYQQS